MIEKPLLAISIRQPWAWLIVHGHKDIENRVWRTHFRGKVLIHAGKAWGRAEKDDRDEVELQFGIRIPEVLPLGGLVGTAEITDCVTKSDSPWFNGPYGFVLANAIPMEFVPCKGELMFFNPHKLA